MTKKPVAGEKPTARKAKTKPGVPGSGGTIGDNSGDDKPMLTPDEEQSLFLTHRRSWTAWKAKRAVVDKLEVDVKAALKADGFKVKQMQIADELTTVKGEKKVTAEVEDRLKVARWVGHPMGAQLDMFSQPDRTPIGDRAYEEGKRASMENEAAKPPYSPDTEAYRHYMAGFHDHQRELAGGIKAPVAEDQSTLAHRQ